MTDLNNVYWSVNQSSTIILSPTPAPNSSLINSTPGELIDSAGMRDVEFDADVGNFNVVPGFGSASLPGSASGIDTAELVKNLRALELNALGTQTHLGSSGGQSGGVGLSNAMNESCAVSDELGVADEVSVSSICIVTHTPVPFSKLNRCDWGEVMRNRDELTYTQLQQLESVARKPEFYPVRFSDDDYLPQSALLILANWGSAQRYSCCGIKNRVNKSGYCKLHKYCPACSSQLKYDKWLTYVPAFENGTWFSVTGSWKGDLSFSTTTPGTDADKWVKYWDAYRAGFTAMVKGKDIHGFYLTEELAVNSFLPARSLPHVHAIVEADWLDEEEIAKLKIAVEGHLAATIGNEHLQADIQVKPIESKHSLMAALRYMHKPLDVTKAYGFAWARECFDSRDLAPELNSQATDLVMGYSEATKGRKKMFCKGALNPKEGRFIGIRKEEHKKYKPTIKALQLQGRNEPAEVECEQQLEVTQ